MIVRWPVLCLTTGLALAAHANPTGSPWYLGLALGKTQVEDFSSNSVRHDFIVGWKPGRHVGLEGSYINLGRHEDAAAPDPLLRVNGFGGAVLGLLPLNDRSTVLARFGLQKLDIERNYEGHETEPARIIGLGAEWKLADRWTVRGEFQSLYGITDRHAAGKYQALSLTVGLFYRLGQPP